MHVCIKSDFVPVDAPPAAEDDQIVPASPVLDDEDPELGNPWGTMLASPVLEDDELGMVVCSSSGSDSESCFLVEPEPPSLSEMEHILFTPAKKKGK